MQIFKGWKKKGFLGIGVLVLALLFCFGMNQEGELWAAEAEGDHITIGGAAVTDVFVFERQDYTALFTGSESGKEFLWEVTTGTEVVKIGGNPGDEKTGKVILYAIGVGDAELLLTVKDTATGDKTYYPCKLKVESAIIQSGFDTDPLNSEKKALILEMNKDTEHTLELLFDADYPEWITSDDGVVEVEPNPDNSRKATVKVNGAGKATITFRYIQSGTSNYGKDSVVDVYIVPSITSDLQSGGNLDTPYYVRKNETMVYPGIKLGSDLNTLNSKLDWCISSGVDGTGIVYVDTSKGIDNGMFVNDGLGIGWDVNAVAGEYYLSVAVKGCLWTDAGVKNRKIRVYAEPEDVSSSLQVGDYFDAALRFNIPTTDGAKFQDYFSWADNNSHFKVDPTTGIITVIAEIDEPQQIVFTAKESKKEYFENYDEDNEENNKYTITFSLYKGFSLNYSELNLPVKNNEVELSAIYENIKENAVSIEWISSKPEVVAVTATSSTGALLETKKVTGAKAEDAVTITCVMTLRDGRVLKATCDVWVYAVAEEIILDKTKIDLRVNKSEEINVQLKPTDVLAADLEWKTSSDIIKLEVSKDGTYATVKASKVGDAVVTVINKDNLVVAYCMVHVFAPVEEITLDKGDYQEVYKYYENYRLTAKISPTDASNTALSWTSSDETVLKVNKDETSSSILVQLVGPGQADIIVRPRDVSVYEDDEIIPKAMCTIKVIESATGIGIDSKSIEVEVGESKEVKYSITSSKASTNVKWESLDSSLVSFEKTETAVKNGEKEKQYITGKKAGFTYIIARTDEGEIATFAVTVTQKASGVTVNPTRLELAVGESKTVTATPVPANSTNTTFTWLSEKENVATVSNGTITGKAPGTTVIWVTPSSGNGKASVVVTVYSKATGMKFETTEVDIVKGEKFTLKPVFTPTNVTNKDVTFTSLNSAIATVDESGVIKGIKGGTTVITGVSEDGGYIATCVVTVKERITTLKLDQKSVNLGVGKKLKLKATVTSNSASNPKLKWTTSNKDIVKVNQKGKITGKKVGTATITVKVTDGSKKKATCKVRVVKAVTSVTLNKRVLNVVVGQTETLKATIKPTDATLKSVTWACENPEIAVVDNGEILGLKVGSTKVTATSKDSTAKSATCYVNVIEEIPATSIILSAQNLTMVKGESENIGYSIVPHNHTDKVYFDSDNRSVATVNSVGKVYARRAGVANITIVTTSGKQALVKVMVLGLNKTKVTMEQYDTETLYIDGVTSGITWFTSNPSVATVAGGKITARKPGTCTVYAKVNGINLACTVVVKKINN